MTNNNLTHRQTSLFIAQVELYEGDISSFPGAPFDSRRFGSQVSHDPPFGSARNDLSFINGT